MKLSFEEIIKATKASVNMQGVSGFVEHISTDTRTLKPGDFYVALKGANFDGHNFVQQAFEKGAVAALISDASFRQDSKVCFLVNDTQHALGDIAQFWRCKFDFPVIGLTGSAGKTTTKDLIASVLEKSGNVCKTEGNLNNLIGVPLTLFKLNHTHNFAVVEMGMNAFGEISRLAQISAPTIALITNVARAHLEGVGSIEGVARAKGELFLELSSNDLALVNLDDPFIAKMPTKAKRLSFGLTPGADVWGHDLKIFSDHMFLKIKTPQWEESFKLPFVGEYLARNWLAAVCVAYALGIEVSLMQLALKDLKMFKHRGELLELNNNMALVDDCYNANPEAMQAAFEALKSRFPSQRRVAVLGDMFELGTEANQIHQEVGEIARRTGVDLLLAVGENAQDYVKGFLKAGGGNAKSYKEMKDLVADIGNQLKAKDAILVKGSRGARMERVIDYLKEEV